MPRARNIKPSFFKNDILAELCPYTRLLFIGLWCLSDREGVVEYRPKKIKAELFPYENDIDVESMVLALCKHGFCTECAFQGEKYLLINNFEKHQNPHIREQAIGIKDKLEQCVASSTGSAPCQHSSSPAESPLLNPETGIKKDNNKLLSKKDSPYLDISEPVANRPKPSDVTMQFDRVCSEYPKNRIDRKTAYDIFYDNSLHLIADDIIQAIKGYKQSSDWRSGYVQKLSTFLDEEKYKDAPEYKQEEESPF